MKKKNGVLYEFKKNAFLYGMTIPGIILALLFSYIPMGGLIIAFQKYSLRTGLKSPFVGLDNFKLLLDKSIFSGISIALRNTIMLNLLFIISTTVMSIILAVAFSEMKAKKYASITQSLSILPYFLSWSVIALILDMFINPSTGMLRGVDIEFYTNASIWRPMLILLRIWQGAGYSAIVYLATITGIDTQIIEAAEIDGANKWRRILHITLPILKPTIILLTLFSVGRIFYGDFGMIYALIGDKSALYPTTDTIDTYVYRMMRQMQRYDITAAIGLLQSVAGLIFVVGANKLAKRFEPDSAIF
ncbi:MAG: ABC transporter permease [Anaerocolumna sp.]